MNTVPPKIAMIIDDNFPPDPRVENQCRALSGTGCRVDLYCITYGNEPLRESNDYMNIIRVPVPSYYKSISALAYTFPFYHVLLYRKFKKVLNLDQYDILHIHDIQVARTAFWLSRKKEVSLVLDLHENRPEIMKYYDHVNSFLGQLMIKPLIWKRFELKYIQSFDHTLVVTEQAKSYYIKNYEVSPKHITVLPNGVSRTFYEDCKVNDDIIERYKHKFVILYLGNTNERRGMRTVLEAVELLKLKIPNLLFLCVGKSKSDPYWQRLANEKGIQNNVELKGWQDFELFPSYVMSCHIGLCPLNRNIHHDMTLANKLFQYMVFEKPVVVSNCDVQEKLIRDNKCGYVFKAGNPESLKEAILFLYQNEKIREEFGRNGKRAVIKSYLWEDIVAELKRVYNEVNQINQGPDH